MAVKRTEQGHASLFPRYLIDGACLQFGMHGLSDLFTLKP